jgi:hypothetical protein
MSYRPPRREPVHPLLWFALAGITGLLAALAWLALA